MQGAYLQALVEHANKARNTIEAEDKAASGIEITDEWYDKLHAQPFMSSKSTLAANPL